MGTIVTIEVVTHDRDRSAPAIVDDAIGRAFEWFREIERVFNRFDATSELRRLCDRPSEAMPASDMLYTAVEFALAVADETAGAFDPTVGAAMERRGFNRDYRDGRVVSSGVMPNAGEPASYRDVALDPAARTILLRRPLVLDLGAVVKGLAIDMAARELAVCEHYAIDAGGDLYVAGRNAREEPWSVGIRHPRRDREVIELLRVSNIAVCTSGDYERQGSGNQDPGQLAHHIIDPRDGQTAARIASATVLAPTAMLADALATAAFVLGPADGISLLERHGVDGLLLTPTLERFMTRGMPSAILSHA